MKARGYHDELVVRADQLLERSHVWVHRPRDSHPVSIRQTVGKDSKVAPEAAENVVVPHEDLGVVESVGRQAGEDLWVLAAEHLP